SMTAPVVARGSRVSDSSGVRQATLVVPMGTSAVMRMPTGTMQPLPTAHIRATEFTVGDDGDKAMPAALPPQSAYTYAVELRADEAGEAKVEFNQPLPFFVENFLGFPVGTTIPSGYYDETRGTWVADESGRVVG